METIYAGEHFLETLTKDQVKLAKVAITNAISVIQSLRTETKQLEEIDWSDGDRGVEAAKVIAALIQAEDFIYKHSTYYPDVVVLGQVQRALRATGRRLVDQGYKSRRWLTIDIWVVAMDESAYWEIPEKWQGKIERIECVQFFDRNLNVHNCSFAGSYEAELVEYRPIVRDDVGEEERGEIMDWVSENADLSETYFTLDVRDVDKFIERNAPGTVYHYGNPGWDLDEARDEAWGKMYNDLRKNRGAKLLETSEETLNKLVDEYFADEDAARGQAERVIIEAVGERLRSNSVL